MLPQPSSYLNECDFQVSITDISAVFLREAAFQDRFLKN